MKESYLFRIYYVDKNGRDREAYEFSSNAEEAAIMEELNEDVEYVTGVEGMSHYEWDGINRRWVEVYE